MSETFRFTPPPSSASPPPQAPRPPDDDPEPEFDPRARLEYLHAVNPPKKKRLWLRILGILILLAIVAGAAVFVHLHFAKKQPATTASQAAPKTQQAVKQTETKIATKEFNSTFFNLSFQYPDTWTANENTQTSRLTVTSPVTSQKTAAGTTEQVRTIVTFAPKGQNLAAFEKGSGLAVRASEKIKYVSPTPAQRAETYLSFIQYSTTAAGRALDGIYITGDNGYEKDQTIPKSDMDGRDPLISVNFEKCSDSKCATAPTAVSLPHTVWDNNTFKQPILVLLTSISVN